jgi:hypothetical protein
MTSKNERKYLIDELHSFIHRGPANCAVKNHPNVIDSGFRVCGATFKTVMWYQSKTIDVVDTPSLH